MVNIDGVRIPPADAVIVVRHGRTALNRADRLRGHLDPDLDSEGRREVHRLARDLAGCNIRKIISSPLKRARQTATAIDQMHHVGVTPDPALIDRDYGEFAGQKEDEVIAEYGSLDQTPGIEPIDDVTHRVIRLLDGLPPELDHGLTVLVSHDAVIKALLSELGVTGTITLRTAGWNLITRDNGNWEPVATNQSC